MKYTIYIDVEYSIAVVEGMHCRVRSGAASPRPPLR